MAKTASRVTIVLAPPALALLTVTGAVFGPVVLTGSSGALLGSAGPAADP